MPAYSFDLIGVLRLSSIFFNNVWASELEKISQFRFDFGPSVHPIKVFFLFISRKKNPIFRRNRPTYNVSNALKMQELPWESHNHMILFIKNYVQLLNFCCSCYGPLMI